jgi:hypothetical protein
MNIGDKVSYIKTTKVKNGYKMSQKEGILLVIGENFSIIKLKNGKQVYVKNTNITTLKEVFFKD